MINREIARTRIVLALCALVPAVAVAQVFQSQPFDLSGFALKADTSNLSSLIAADQAQSQSALNLANAANIIGQAAASSASAAQTSANSAGTAAAAAQTTANAANGLAQTAVQPNALTAAAAANLTAMQQITPTFVNNGTYMATADLLNQFPCVTATLGKLAHVSDLYGTVSSTLVCEASAGSFYWRPQRTDYAASIAIASGTATLVPLATAPIVYLPSTPTGTVNISLSTTNVWPGASFHIYAPPTISALSPINLTGIVGGGTLTMAQGSDKILTYVPGYGWKSN